VIKLVNYTFCDNLLLNSIQANFKVLNFLFLKFYVLLVQRSFRINNYFFFNFLFYKKLWLSTNLFLNKNSYKLSFKNFYKKYYFLNYSYMSTYNYMLSHNIIFFLKNNKNSILKKNFFFLNFIKLNSFFLLLTFFKNLYFFELYVNFWINFFLINLKNFSFFSYKSLTFRVFKNVIISHKYTVKSIRYFPNTSLLEFNNLI
jgi:hypothetical protein